MVPGRSPVETPVVVVKLVKPLDEGEKPVVPTAKFQVVEPPVVQVNVAVVDVTSVNAKLDGSGHSG